MINDSNNPLISTFRISSAVLKGIVHPKFKFHSVYSPSCRLRVGEVSASSVAFLSYGGVSTQHCFAI